MENQKHKIEEEKWKKIFSPEEEFTTSPNYFDELPLKINSKITVQEKKGVWLVWSGAIASVIGIVFFALIVNYNNSKVQVSAQNSSSNTYIEQYLEEEASEDEIMEYYFEEQE